MKKLLLILILNVSLLFSPSPERGTTDPNGRYVKLTPYAGFFLNPDTYGFIFPAISPKQLLEYHAQRQNRPLFILAGSAAGYSITFLTWPLHNKLLKFYGKFWRGTYPEEKILYIGNFYLGYILINILILWSSLYLFEKIFYRMVRRTGSSDIAMFLLMIFIVSNSVTKAFFWTPHLQMFAFLTPLLCIYLLYGFEWLKSPSRFLHWAGTSLLGGILLLIYGNFIMLLPTLIYSYAWHTQKITRLKNRQIILPAIFLAFLFFVPTLLWIGILRWNGIIYYNFEIRQYHDLVWIPETLRRSVPLFFQQLLSNTRDYFLTMSQLFILVVFSVIIFIAGKIKISVKNEWYGKMTFVFLSFFIFYWLLGTYFDRLTNTLIPVIVSFWIVMLGQNITARKFIYILSSLALTWHLYVQLSYGPFY